MKVFLSLCSVLFVLADFAVAAENRCVIGTKLGKDGKVAEKKTAFAPNEPIRMTVQSASTPHDKLLTVEVLDMHGEEMKTLWIDLKKDNSVTFPIRKLERGRYVAKAILDKKNVCEASVVSLKFADKIGQRIREFHLLFCAK